MNWLIQTMWTNRTYNDVFTIFLYWLPLMANAVAYSLRIFQRVQADKDAISGRTKYYSEWLKVGDLIGYIAATIIPLANLCCFVFDTMADLWQMAWNRMSWLFNIRLVGSDRNKEAGHGDDA